MFGARTSIAHGQTNKKLSSGDFAYTAPVASTYRQDRAIRAHSLIDKIMEFTDVNGVCGALSANGSNLQPQI